MSGTKFNASITFMNALIMKKYFLFLLVISFTFSSCGDFQDVTFKGVENVKVVKMSQQGIEVDITARIHNPNKVVFHIYPSDMDATLNDINAGKAHLTNNIRIRSNSEESYTFKIKSDFSSLNMMELPRLMSVVSGKNVKVGLKGNLKVGKFFLKRNYPVDIIKSIPLSGF
jgi:LEA14-like dessication related protein